MKNYFVRSGLLCLTYMVVFASLPKLLMSQPLVSKAGFYELPGAGREVFNFNVGWKFRKGEQSGAFELNFNDSFWEAVNLPHSLELLPTEASGGVNYQGSAWYRKHFEVPASWAGKKLFLHFEAIMGKSRIWVDGIEVMSHYGGYLPVVVDISQLSQKPGEHLIAVWCDNSDDGFYPPGKPQGTLDFSYFGGIYRDAWLVTTSPVYVTDPNFANNVAGGGVLIHFDEFSESKVVVGVNTDVKNELTRHGEFWVCQRLVDDKGEEVASVKNKVTIPAGSSLKSIQKLVVESPRMWMPDSPVLYRLETTVRDRKGKVFDGIASRIGIRKIEFRGRDGFYLNGQPYQDKLIGGNRHQDYAYVGNALPNSGQWRDAKKLRDAGMRIIRSAHYPQDPAFMDACDELGLFVIVATPGWQFWNEVPHFEQRVYNDIRNMVRRDRNHPSVIMWEPILNETWYPSHFAKATHELVKEEYPYQGAYTVCDSEARGHEWFDVQYTHPFGNVLFDNHLKNDEEGKDKARLDYSNFKQSLFTREWGDNVDDWNSHNSPSRVARQWGEIPQLVQAMHYANPPYLFTSYETLYRTPRQMIGGCLWHPFDHQRGYHPDPFYGGILDVFRQPKYAYYLFASQRTPIAAKGRAGTGPVVFIAHEMTPFSPADVTVFTNCEELRLIVNEKDTLVKKMQQEGGMPHPVAVFKEVFEFMDVKALHRSGNSQKASFVAEGLIGGIVVAKDKRMAALRPSKIILWVDNEGIPLVANGSDFIPVIAAMADEAGHVKRLNEYEISFKIEGEGEIIGGREIGANPRKVEWGTAPVLIRSTTQNGKIKVKASVSFAGITMPVSGEIEFESITANEQFLNGIKLPEVIKGAGSVYQEAVESDELLKRIVELERELNQYKLKEVEKQQAEFEGGSEK